jgi:hypothetical protein
MIIHDLDANITGKKRRRENDLEDDLKKDEDDNKDKMANRKIV